MNTKLATYLILSLLTTVAAFGQSLPYTPLSIDLSGITYKDEPSVVRTQDGRVHVFVRRSNDDQLYVRTLNGTTWSHWQSLGGVCTSGPSAATIGNTIHVFVRSSDNAIHTRSWNPTSWWGGWQSLGGVLSSAPSAVANVWPGYVYVYARGADGAVLQQAWNGSAWLGWVSIGGAVASGPSAVSPSPGRIHIVARGTDGAIWQQHYNGSAWVGWRSLGGSFVGSPSAVPNVWVNHVHVYARAADGTIWQQSFNGSSWGSWSSLGGNVTGNPTAYSLAHGRLNVLAKNNTEIRQRIYAGWSSRLNWLDWSTWPKMSLTVCAKADFGAVGDGIADDSNALQMALDYLAAHDIDNCGGCLVLPAGTYKITRRLNFVKATGPRDMKNQGITIRGNESQGANPTTIFSASTEGALFFNINDTEGHFYQFGVCIRDLRIQAGVANAGAAIEIQRMPAIDNVQSVVPLIKNVAITTDTSARFFRYGVVGRRVLLPEFTDTRVTGVRGGTEACIFLDRNYSFTVNNCQLSGANTGIHAVKGGEGNDIMHTTITDVNTGINMHVDPGDFTGPSSLGGALYGCDISAWEAGVIIDHKGYFPINDNNFTSLGTSSSYRHLTLKKVHRTIVTDNIFTGAANQTGVYLESPFCTRNTVAYNRFGSLTNAVHIGTGVSETAVLDNFPAAAPITNAGTGTFVRRNAPRPFKDTPTRAPVYGYLPGRVLVPWNAMAHGPVINVTHHGANGLDGLDDTAALQSAVSALRTSLNSTGQGTLYFPAGLYRLSSRLDLTQGSANWQRVTICGDGGLVSGIAVTNAQGVFKIDCSQPVPIFMHGFRIDPLTPNPSTAIDITQRNGTVHGARSLLMQDVRIFTDTGIGRYFSGGIKGTGVVRPLLQNVDMRCVETDVSSVFGLHFTGGYGFDWQEGSIHGKQTSGIVESLGGEVNIRGPRFAGGGLTSLTVDANGGSFSLNASHIDSPVNLRVTDASEAVVINTLTIAGPQNPSYAGAETSYFGNCTNLYFRDNILSAAYNTPRPANVFIRLGAAPATCNGFDISGNMMIFNDGEGTGIRIPAGNLNGAVRDNRFFGTSIANIVCQEPSTVISLLP